MDPTAPPSPGRSSAPTPPPSGNVATPPPAQPSVSRQPIRVAVERRIAEVIAEPAHAPTPEPLPERALVPDEQRSLWVLDQLLDAVVEIRDSTSWIRPLNSSVAKAIELLERADKRDEERVRDARDRREAELATQLTTPLWRRAIDHPHAGRAFALLTWISGAATMAGLDYLGLESEPLFRFFAAIWGP